METNMEISNLKAIVKQLGLPGLVIAISVAVISTGLIWFGVHNTSKCGQKVELFGLISYTKKDCETNASSADQEAGTGSSEVNKIECTDAKISGVEQSGGPNIINQCGKVSIDKNE